MTHPLLAPGTYTPEKHPGLRNLLVGMRRVVCVPMLQQMTVDEAMALWRWCNWHDVWESIP